jgi:tetratricopeptide (TPR) repeat protein
MAPALVAAVLLLYLPALSNDFVNWDDDRLVTDNPVVSAPEGLRRIWSTVELPKEFPNYPLTFTSFWLEHQLWGFHPAGYHLSNLILHALNAVLVLLLMRALGATQWVGGLTAVLFACHPMQVESVAWVAERKNVLSTFFCLLAFLAYLRHRTSGAWGWYGVSLLAFVCALLSKTAALVLPVLIVLAERFRTGRWSPGAVLRSVPLFLLGAAAAWLTLVTERHPLAVAPAARPLLAASALSFYVGKLLIPVGLFPIYPLWNVSFVALRWWLPLIGLLVAVLCLRAWLIDWRVRWGVAGFACALLPVLGLRPFGFNEYSYVADRHVYLASIGLFLVVALTIERLCRRLGRRTATLVVCLPVLGLSLLTWRQIHVWRNSISLWTHALVGNPRSWAAHNNLALALADHGRSDEAAQHLHAALEIRPDYPEAHNNLALLLYREGDFRAAAQHCQQAVALRPDTALYRKNLGLALQAKGDFAAAEVAYRGALALAPEEAGYHYLLGNVLADRGHVDEAERQLDAALRIQPDFALAREALAALHAQHATP